MGINGLYPVVVLIITYCTFEKYGNNILVGGSFTQAGNIVVNRIAIWNPLLQVWNSMGNGFNDDVAKITVDGDDIYAVGAFTFSGNDQINRIAKWDANFNKWISIGVGANDLVRSLIINGDDFYFAGFFTSIGGIKANHIAKWNKKENSWSALGNGITGSNSYVYNMAIKDDYLFVVGGFSAAGETSANNVAVWNVKTSKWSALGSGTNAEVGNVAVGENEVYFVGIFTRAGEKSSYYLAKYKLPGSVPNKPTLIYPSNNETISIQNLLFRWNEYGSGSYFRIQVSTKSDFSQIVLDQNNILNSYFPIDNLSLGTAYYWRVCATNVFGTSAWSDVWSFKVEKSLFGLSRVKLSLPLNNATNITMYTSLIWLPLEGATLYHLQLALDPNFSELLIDKYDISNGYFQIDRLLSNTKYYWRVRATNGKEWCLWSEERNFTTKIVSGVDEKMSPGEYIICQNYPNPFNPSTKISYIVGTHGDVPVQLKIYDILGKEIITLVNEYKQSGNYSVEWRPENEPSGIYYYKIIVGNKSKMGKMVYMR